MFSSIKDKFLKTVPLFNTSPEDKKKQPHVDLSAGSEILNHFEKHWETLHATNEENVKKSGEIVTIIDSMNSKIEQEKTNLRLMTHLIANTNLATNISSCTKQIGGLFEQFNRVEEELVALEDLIDNIAFENMKKQHRYHLEQYRNRKNEEINKLEKSLEENYNKTLEENELKKKKELEERQLVFQEAFRNDLELFKNSGMIPKLDLPKKQPSALLEEIQVDYDENELNQFFNDGVNK